MGKWQIGSREVGGGSRRRRAGSESRATGGNGKWQSRKWGRTSPWFTLRVNLSPSAARRGTAGPSLALRALLWGGFWACALGGAVGAGDGSEDVGGGSAAFDGALGGLAEFAEGVEGFLGDLVVVALALEGAELFEGFVGVLDVGLVEPGRELEGERVGSERVSRRRSSWGGKGEWKGGRLKDEG
jgi:hypothetical protein